MKIHILATFVLCLLFVACDDSSPTQDIGPHGDGDADADFTHDADATGDADGDEDADPDPDEGADAAPDAERLPTDHQTYVPPSLRPTDASRLIVLGDSISAGVGASLDTLTYFSLLQSNASISWPDDNDHDLTSYFGGDVELINVARSGATTQGLAQQIGTLGQQLPTPVSGHSIVVLTIGGNDLQMSILQGDPEGEVLDNAISALRSLAGHFADADRYPDGASVYVAGVYDPSDTVGQIPGCFYDMQLPALAQAIVTWRQRYLDLGEELGFAVIDAYTHFLGHGHHAEDPNNEHYHQDDPTNWFSDCIHPDVRGHHELRRLFYEAIDRSYYVM